MLKFISHLTNPFSIEVLLKFNIQNNNKNTKYKVFIEHSDACFYNSFVDIFAIDYFHSEKTIFLEKDKTYRIVVFEFDTNNHVVSFENIVFDICKEKIFNI